VAYSSPGWTTPPPFRRPGMEATVRGRSWAIYDGILGETVHGHPDVQTGWRPRRSLYVPGGSLVTMHHLPDYLDVLTIPTPFPVGPVNVYLVKGDDGPTLIDVGPRFGPAQEALREALAARGYQLSDVKRVILTHVHSDHCGLAGELAEESGAEVLTHPANFLLLADYAEERERWLAFYAALMREAGMPPEQIVQVDRLRRGMSNYIAPCPAHRCAGGGGYGPPGG
jgi:hypothetical protein